MLQESGDDQIDGGVLHRLFRKGFESGIGGTLEMGPRDRLGQDRRGGGDGGERGAFKS